MSLTTNTASLQDILAAVNALPDAGGGSTWNYASGTFTGSGGKTTISIEGLGFKPKAVHIYTLSGTATSTVTPVMMMASMVEGAEYPAYAYATYNTTKTASVGTSTAGTSTEITFTVDGFSATPHHKWKATKYYWVAGG